VLVPPNPRRTLVVVGTASGLGGILILLLAVGVIGDPRDVHAPRWVVGAAGLAFVLAGIVVAIGPADGRPTAASAPVAWRSRLVGGAIVGLMAVAPNWIAFGPGERRFGGMLGLPLLAVSPAVSETTGRVAFGIAAVLLDAIFAWIVVRGIRALLADRSAART
jgi:hypothetical protein